MIIAIDGPAGAGKTTSSLALSKELGIQCLDTGAMYRCIALDALNQGIALDDTDGLLRVVNNATISFSKEGDDERVVLNGVDVTNDIRTPAVDKAVTPVSANSDVRRMLVPIQREIGNNGDYVIEGRDIGTVVFPNADVKIFLTASLEERARRRVKQKSDNGEEVDYSYVIADLARRDQADSARKDSPLKRAADAVIIDSTYIDFDVTLTIMMNLIRKKMKQYNS